MGWRSWRSRSPGRWTGSPKQPIRKLRKPAGRMGRQLRTLIGHVFCSCTSFGTMLAPRSLKCLGVVIFTKTCVTTTQSTSCFFFSFFVVFFSGLHFLLLLVSSHAAKLGKLG